MFAKDRVGFMPGLYVAFLGELSADDKNKFEALSCQESRANMILNHPFISDKFDNIQVIDSKDNAKSSKTREEGNVLFQSGNFQASLVKYSSAVTLAKVKSKELSLALANRSAALQRLNYHTKGVQDIDAALDSGYPIDKQFKIFERKGQLLRELKQFDKARDCYVKASNLVKQSSINETKREKFRQEMDLQIAKLKEKADSALPETVQKESDRGTELLELIEPHHKYKSLHKNVEVKVTKEQGRFTVAREDIAAGTTLLVEEPLGWALEVEKFPTNCQHCLSPVTVIVPCPGCVSVIFCSTECRDKGRELYHGRECGMMGILAASALNNFCLLTVRAITRSGVQQIIELSRDKTEDVDIYDGTDLRTAFNLVSHEVSTEDLLMRTLVSVFLMKCLKMTEFYGRTVTSHEEDLAVSQVIYKILSSCPANTHEIHYLKTPSLDRWSPMASLQDLGAGLYPTAALFNHSCDPNIVRCNVGRRMISVASKGIKKGEEISDCYGLPWYSKNKKERTFITRKFYKFQCHCRPCQEDWVTSDLLARTSLAELSRLDLDLLHSRVQSVGEKLYTSLEWRQGLQDLNELYSQMSYLCPPTLEHFHLHISVWRSIWMLVGNKKKVSSGMGW